MSACPRLRMGVLVANLLSPAEQQESGKCGLISPMQVSSLTSKKYDEAARVSEQLMDAMRNATQNVGVDCSKELGRTDARIVYHLLGIGAKSADRRAFTTLDEIATQFADGIAKLSGKPNGQSFYNNELRKAMKAIGPKLQTPIAEKKAKTKAAAAAVSSDATPATETLAEAKSRAFQVRKWGFNVDVCIADRKRKSQCGNDELPVFKIVKMTESAAVCVQINGPKGEDGSDKNVGTIGRSDQKMGDG